MFNELYTEIILENSRNKKNRGELKSPSKVERGHNPSCGDDLTLMVNIEDDIIKDAKFIGDGCAISTASISIMIDLIKDKDIAYAKSLIDSYFRMVQGKEITNSEREALEDAALFESLQDMPARIKCGTLGWHCLKVMIAPESD